MLESKIIHVHENIADGQQKLMVFALNQNDEYCEFIKAVDVNSSIEDLRDFFQECADECEQIRINGEEVQ